MQERNEELYKKEVQPTSIKLSKNLHAKIKELATKESRSVSGQIEYMLKKYLEIKNN